MTYRMELMQHQNRPGEVAKCRIRLKELEERLDSDFANAMKDWTSTEYIKQLKAITAKHKTQGVDW